MSGRCRRRRRRLEPEVSPFARTSAISPTSTGCSPRSSGKDPRSGDAGLSRTGNVERHLNANPSKGPPKETKNDTDEISDYGRHREHGRLHGSAATRKES